MIRASPSIRSLLRGALVRAALVVTSLGVFIVAGELTLRSFPPLLPRGTFYGSGVYDPELGFLMPNSTVIYNKVRFLKRTPNGDGLMDVGHDPEKPPGVVRVGFFGDSYVESVQVPLEAVFFRRLPRAIHGRPIETFGFGISGLGTLHALQLYRKYGPRYDLDLVVYLFVNNDPGDHFYRIQRHRHGLVTPRPTAMLAADEVGYELRWPPTRPFAVRAAMAVKSRSLLARVAHSRLQLLLAGRGGGRGEGAGASDSPLTAPRIPSEEDPPSVWPEDLLAEARLLTRRILAQWKREVRGSGRDLLVLYVPRTEEVEGGARDEDTWRLWLADSCRALDLELIDPTAALGARRAAGEAVYDDHWTPAGHEVIASVLSAELEAYLRRGDEPVP